MKVCVIGSGGREHAICSALKNSTKVSKIYCVPGNAGTNLIAENVQIELSNFEQITWSPFSIISKLLDKYFILANFLNIFSLYILLYESCCNRKWRKRTCYL